MRTDLKIVCENMALNAIVLIVLGVLPSKFESLKYSGILLSLVLVCVPFILVAMFLRAVFRAYRRALMMDPRAPADDFFQGEQWRQATTVAYAIAFLLWVGIVFSIYAAQTIS